MATTKIDVQLQFDGPTPLVTGDKRLTLLNLAQLLNALNHGSRYKVPGNSTYVSVTPSMVAASATVTIATPTTGQTVTIAGTAMTAQQSRARATLTCTSVAADETFTLGGVVFTAVDGAVTLGDATFDCSGTDTECATSIAAQVNGYVGQVLTGRVSAKSAATVATIIANAEGTSGNSITLVSGQASIVATGSGFLAGGAAVANNKFDFGSTNAQVAASLARAVNASTTAAIQKVTAASDGVDVVTLTAKFLGDGGEAITLTSSDGATLAVTGSGFLASGSQGATTRYEF